jgi:hypothetical protein
MISSSNATFWAQFFDQIGGLLERQHGETLAILARMPERRLKAFQNRQQGQFCQDT